MANSKIFNNINVNVKNILLTYDVIRINNKPYNYSSLILVRRFFNPQQFTRKKKEYHARKLVGFSMDQMYSVVSDVEKYKEFLPFCNQSDILQRKEGYLKANLAIGFPPIKECYISNVTMRKPYLVQAICTEGKLFDYLETAWKFMPGLKTVDQSCVIDFYVSFQFKSLLHSQLSHIFFDQLVKQMEKAFITETERRYGKPTTKVIPLSTMAEA